METVVACRQHNLPTGVNCKVLAVVLLAVLLTAFFNYSLLRVVAQCSALACGYFLTTYLITYSKGEFLWDFFERLLGEKLTTDETAVVGKTDVKEENANQTRTLPWKGVNIPEPVDKALEELVEQLIDNYVNSWYKTKISDDAAFVNEIRYQIRYAIAVLYLRIRKIDLSSMILFEAFPLAAAHCDRVHRLYTAVDKSLYPPQIIETKILEAMPDAHFALSSRQNEVDYLRQLAEHIVGLVLDESRIAGYSSDNDSPFRDALTNHSRPWPSHVCRHFLRELFVFSFFLPLLDLIADPDTVNRILIFLFDSDVLSYPQMSQDTKQVEILHGLTEHSLNGTSDSLLQLKLSDMLRDTRQLLIFRTFMKDIHAPLNELDFLLHAGDAHERMLNIQNDNSAVSELHYDVWEIFCKYIHECAPERVDLPLEISAEFSEAVEKSNFDLLDRCLEKAFQLVYKRMQYEYVVPFCQSESFLGHLCGSPPVSVDELIASAERSNSSRRLLPAVESNFSLTQFRNRFWRMVMPTTVDGSVDSSFEHLSDIALQNWPDSGPVEPADDITQGLDFQTPAEGEQPAMPTFESALNDTSEEKSEGTVDNRLISSSDEELIERQASSSSSYELPMFDPDRDMSRWMVTIPRIEPRRDPVGGHTMYVYVIVVERFDVKDENEQQHCLHAGNEVLQTRWSLIRRYNEFYVLESKLLEFHGNTIKTESLPSRRPFNVKSRAYVESQREHFERFIQLLTKQPALKRSDLLFAFLTSEQELKESTQISDLYPWNVVRKMPSKFARERGQNLKPFILSLLATTLAPHSHIYNDYEITLKRNEHSEASSLSSFNPEILNRARKALQSNVFGNNCPTVQINFSNTNSTLWTRSLYDSVLFIFNHLFGVVRWPLWIMVTIRRLMGGTLDAVATVLFRRFINGLFVETNCIRMIRFVQDSIFGADSSATTDQEKILRMELAQRLTLEYLQEQLPNYFIRIIGQKQFRHGIQTIVRILQFPRLNKQLSYVYLDVLAQKLFPMEDERNLEIK